MPSIAPHSTAGDFAAGDLHTQGEIEQAIYAIQCFAQTMRPRPEGWEPLIHVKPTHAAMYTGAEEAQLKHWKDVTLAERDKIYNEFDLDDDEELRKFSDLFSIEYNDVTGAAEWVPGIGPAPIWTHPDAAHTMTRQEMADELDAWIKERW